MGATGELSKLGYRGPSDAVLAGVTLRALDIVGSSAWRERAASLAMGRLKLVCAQDGSSSAAGCACRATACCSMHCVTWASANS